MNQRPRTIFTLGVTTALACVLFLFAAGCSSSEPEPAGASYQAVVVAPAERVDTLYVVQAADLEMSSGLIILNLPGKTTADVSTLVSGDVIDVFGSDAIALSYPGQASCTDIVLVGHIEGDVYAPFAAEWKTFESVLANAESDE